MKPELVQLEAALADAWDRDTLAVYADHLQLVGDPRGELIAIDLQIEDHGTTSELVNRRTSILHGWLGRHVPSNPHGGWIGDSLRCGFVEDLRIESQGAIRPHEIEALLATPLAGYIRGLTCVVDVHQLEVTFRLLSRIEHAHCARISISCTTSGGPLERIATSTTDGAAALATVMQQCPRLQTLEVRGNQVLQTVPHPTLRHLRVTGFDAVIALVDGTGDPLAIESLDYAIDDGRGWAEQVQQLVLPPALPETMLAPALLPALRRLDLSRNEAEILSGYRMDLNDPDVDDVEMEPLDLFAWLRRLPIRAGLTHLRVPSVRSEADARALRDAIAGMPALVELEIARGHYFRVPDLQHATARIVAPPPWPWPEPREVRADALRITVPRSQHEVDVHVAEAVSAMEASYETLPLGARDAWTAFWQVESALRRASAAQQFSAALLLRALEAVELASWRELRMELRAYPLAEGAQVTIERTDVIPWE